MSSANPTRILPLWKAWLEENAGRIQYGAQFTSEELVKFLDQQEDSIGFAMSVHEIRKALRRRGMVLTARGEFGKGYRISPPSANMDEMKRMEKAAASALREAVVLGTSTPLDALTQEERRLHESLLEKVSTRLALMNRKQPVKMIQGS